MNINFKLNRIPFWTDDEVPENYNQYDDFREFMYRHFDLFNKALKSVVRSVNGVYTIIMEEDFEEMGMEAFFGILMGTLWMMDKGEVEKDQMTLTIEAIKQFEEMNPKELFTEYDYEHIQKDIEIIKNYFEEHPELTK